VKWAQAQHINATLSQLHEIGNHLINASGIDYPIHTFRRDHQDEVKKKGKEQRSRSRTN
jgi:hypothetical protein